MSKAIVTKYLGATNFKGSRIKASAEGGNSITISYPHEYDSEQAHATAALALCRKMGWDKSTYLGDGLLGGGTDTGWVFVFSNSPKYSFGAFGKAKRVESGFISDEAWSS